MKRKYIIIAILIIIASYYARVVLAAQRLYFAVGSIKNLKLSGGVITWRQIIRVTNGENVAIPITSANIENRINNSTIGRTILAQSQTIAARSSTDLLLDVYIPLSDLLGLSLEILNTVKTGFVSFELAGHVRALGVSVPISQKFNLDLKHLF
ncbi:LEA type 2 family protein [Emticicia soli]|uniref:LEA type 2 family protein n=1 Tax=Emticicia soli TaxID=2027878 RepID=A0ABW5J752_9BACT